MARLLRASLLPLALGVATLGSPVASAAANGGAAPASPPVATASEASGGAAPGMKPAGSGTTASSSQVGGARPGAKPASKRRAKPRRKGKPRKPAPPKAPAVPTPPPTPTPDVPTVAGVFPIQGVYDFGGEGARFGAGRPGHIHQGQDVIAADGTPLVSPVAGTVTWKANQEGGAGIYLVIRGAGSGERDYVFMHLKRGSVLVAPGDAVAPGQQSAPVGNTGASSGPHLHFEIWVGGWYAKGGAPIDPLPQLQRWAS